MTDDSAVRITQRVAEAVRTVHGVRPAAPALRKGGALLGWDPQTLAIDLHDELVEIRVVATALPLPPRLDQVGAAIRAVLAGTRFADARLRLRVIDIDACAFAEETTE
ncbi:MAG: hypothetical protein ACRDRN_07540 [Sciscionella sp.]